MVNYVNLLIKNLTLKIRKRLFFRGIFLEIAANIHYLKNNIVKHENCSMGRNMIF